MNATVRFYLGFAIVLAIVIGISYYAGARAGAAACRAARTHHAST